MKKKNTNSIARKNISVFEILILVASILAFSYFVGNEFKFVSASDAAAPSTGDNVKTVTEIGAAAAAASGAAKTASTATLPTAAGAALAPEGEAYLAGTSATGQQVAAAAEAADTGTKTAAAAKSAGTFMTRLSGSFQVLLWNAVIAAGIYGIIQLLRLFPGADQDLLNQLSIYLSVGYAVGAGLYVIGNALFGSSAAGFGATVGFGLIGLGIAAILFIFTYHKSRIDAVQFNCYPWQPSKGGGANGRDDCQQCNKGQLPCTKYKCESLGLSCELLNEGTNSEVCIWNNRNDIEPPLISSWKEILPAGFSYTPDTARLPPDKGVIIKANTSDGCVAPFTRITYGITLNKPGMCKVDTNRTDTFDNMAITLDQGYYLYNHSIMSIPSGIANENDSGISVTAGGNYETYVRCQSKNGYSNVGTFVFKYCVQDEPDTTAPTIEVVNPTNNMPIQYGSTSKRIDVYVNKPSSCKWSHSDQSYDDMAETMNCALGVSDVNAYMLYHCSANLTGLKDEAENDFYFRCKSYPGNNESDRYANTASYKYTLIGTRDLVIDSISPKDGDLIKDSTQSVKVTLDVKTSAGYKDGEATCSYSDTSGTNSRYVLFANTNSYQSTQDLWLDTGSYDYTIKCCDLGGNCKTETTSFDVETDSESPRIIRIYNDVNLLKLVTIENAECVYDTTSCSYNFEDGLSMTSSDSREHSTEWNVNDVFYIKCKDEYGNQPSPDECSLIARPVSSY
jgi:hypothetical protein